MRKRVLNWNHQPVKPYTLALARESGGMADAISASERPDCCCSFTTLQSTWSVDIELHPEIPPARTNVPSVAAIPSLRKASVMKKSPPRSNASRPQCEHAHDIIMRLN